MTEADYFGYTYTRPPNDIVAGIIMDWQHRNIPFDVLSSMYGIDELTIRLIIKEVLFTEVEKPQVIVRISRV